MYLFSMKTPPMAAGAIIVKKHLHSREITLYNMLVLKNITVQTNTLPNTFLTFVITHVPDIVRK